MRMRGYKFFIILYFLPYRFDPSEQLLHYRNHNHGSPHLPEHNTNHYAQLLMHYKSPHRFQNVNHMKQILPYLKSKVNWNRMDYNNSNYSNNSVGVTEINTEKPMNNEQEINTNTEENIDGVVLDDIRNGYTTDKYHNYSKEDTIGYYQLKPGSNVPISDYSAYMNRKPGKHAPFNNDKDYPLYNEGFWLNDYNLNIKNRVIGFTPYWEGFKGRLKNFYNTWVRKPYNKWFKGSRKPPYQYSKRKTSGFRDKFRPSNLRVYPKKDSKDFNNYAKGIRPNKLRSPAKKRYSYMYKDCDYSYDYYTDFNDYYYDCHTPHYYLHHDDHSDSKNITGIISSLFGDGSSTVLMMAGMIGFLLMQNAGTMGFMGFIMTSSPLFIIIGLVKYFIYNLVSSLIKMAIIPFIIPFIALLIVPFLLLIPFLFLLLLPIFLLPILIPFLLKFCSSCSSDITTISYNYTVIFAPRSPLDQGEIFSDLSGDFEDEEFGEARMNKTVLERFQTVLDSEYCLENVACNLATNTKAVKHYNDLIYGVLEFMLPSIKDPRFRSYMKAYNIGSDVTNNHTTCSFYYPCTSYLKLLNNTVVDN